MFRDPRHWSHPDTFNPDQWTAEERSKRWRIIIQLSKDYQHLIFASSFFFPGLRMLSKLLARDQGLALG